MGITNATFCPYHMCVFSNDPLDVDITLLYSFELHYLFAYNSKSVALNIFIVVCFYTRLTTPNEVKISGVLLTHCNRLLYCTL